MSGYSNRALACVSTPVSTKSSSGPSISIISLEGPRVDSAGADEGVPAVAGISDPIDAEIPEDLALFALNLRLLLVGSRLDSLPTLDVPEADVEGPIVAEDDGSACAAAEELALSRLLRSEGGCEAEPGGGRERTPGGRPAAAAKAASIPDMREGGRPCEDSLGRR